MAIKDRIMRFFGALKDKNIDWNKGEKRMREFRDSFEKRINKTSEYMEQVRKKWVIDNFKYLCSLENVWLILMLL